jgi:hypothetical protein
MQRVFSLLGNKLNHFNKDKEKVLGKSFTTLGWFRSNQNPIPKFLSSFDFSFQGHNRRLSFFIFLENFKKPRIFMLFIQETNELKFLSLNPS